MPESVDKIRARIGNRQRDGNQTAGVAFRLLTVLSVIRNHRFGLTLTELATESELPRTTVRGYLQSMQETDFIRLEKEIGCGRDGWQYRIFPGPNLS